MPQPRRRQIAALREPLVGGVGIFDVCWGDCRWPMTEVSPISDFRYCGAPVVDRCWCSVHADVALQRTRRLEIKPLLKMSA